MCERKELKFRKTNAKAKVDISQSGMKTDTKIILAAVAASVFIIMGAAVVLGKDTRPKREQLGTSAVNIATKSADLGTMKVSDERSADFTIANPSDSVLRIWNVTTSCNCTFATITIDGVDTGEFSMHTGGALKNWIGEIAPGASANLKVIYRPSVMPVQGPISRQVNFSTNDPSNPEMQVEITATVL